MPARYLPAFFQVFCIIMCCACGCVRQDTSTTACTVSAPTVGAFLRALARADSAEIAAELIKLGVLSRPPETVAMFDWSIGATGVVAWTPDQGERLELTADRFLLLQDALELISNRIDVTAADQAQVYELVFQLGESISECAEELGDSVPMWRPTDGAKDPHQASARSEIALSGLTVQRIAFERLRGLPRELVPPGRLDRCRVALDLARQRMREAMSDVERASGLKAGSMP